MESAPKINPPGIQEFPKQRAAVFEEVTQGATFCLGHRVTVDMDAFQHFESSRATLDTRAQHRHLVPILMQGLRLLPYAWVEGDGGVLNDNQNFSIHVKAS